jgi:hypothetical protein
MPAKVADSISSSQQLDFASQENVLSDSVTDLSL